METQQQMPVKSLIVRKEFDNEEKAKNVIFNIRQALNYYNDSLNYNNGKWIVVIKFDKRDEWHMAREVFNPNLWKLNNWQAFQTA
jgi:hypothetical protein